MVFFAQIVVKQWSWVLKQGDWLEMISIYLTLVWFEVLYKDPDSRNNEIFSGERHLASKPCRFKRHASEKSNPWPTSFFLLTGSPILWSLKKFKSWKKQSLYNREILEVFDAVLYSKV